jgi:hypothetical protein
VAIASGGALMSIRYKLFGIFCIVTSLTCGLAFYGIRGISTSGDLVVHLYDGPLMGINYARSAHAAMNEPASWCTEASTKARPGTCWSSLKS